MTTARTLAGLGLAVLLGGALAACAAPGGETPTPSETTHSAPDEPTAQDDDTSELEAAWLDSGRMIGVVTIGSSTCVPTAGEVTGEGQSIQVELRATDPEAPCTTDLVPRVTVVAVPEGVDPAQDVQIHVAGTGFDGDIDLDGVDGLDPSGSTDYLPSAGWAGDGQLVILTWGSSSCPPVVETAAATAPAEVTVTFAAPPEDQVCTMDMAPRGTGVVVEDLDDDADAVVVLTGAEFDDVRVPIIGGD